MSPSSPSSPYVVHGCVFLSGQRSSACGMLGKGCPGMTETLMSMMTPIKVGQMI